MIVPSETDLIPPEYWKAILADGSTASKWAIQFCQQCWHQKGVPARAPGWGEDLAGLGLDTPAKVLWQVCRFGRMSSRYAPRGEQYQPELGPGADAAEVSEMQLAMDNLAARYAARHPGGPVPGSGVGVPMAGELLDPLLEKTPYKRLMSFKQMPNMFCERL